MDERRSLSKARGFTLTELVCTLLILGVLATRALPGLVDMSDEAYDSIVRSTGGSLSAAVLIATADCLVRGWAGRDNLPGYATGQVDFNAGCHPTDTGNSNVIGGSAARCARVWQAVLAGAPSIQTGTAGSSEYRAFAAGEICRFRYIHDAAPVREITYNAATGDVGLP